MAKKMSAEEFAKLEKNALTIREEYFIFKGAPKKITIEERVDPFFPQHISIISEIRAERTGRLPEKKPQNSEEDEKMKKECYFEPENIHKTPEPRTYYHDLTRDLYIPVTVPNLYAFSKHGTVNCFTSHDRNHLERLEMPDWYNYLAMTTHNAHALIGKNETEMFSTINWGREAGGSQDHPHSQDGVQSLKSRQGEERVHWNSLEGLHADTLEAYLDFLESKNLIGYRTSDVVVAAPWAPRFPHELLVFVTNPISNFTHLDRTTASRVAHGLYLAANFLAAEKGANTMNFGAFQESLDSFSPYRLHFRLHSREFNIIASRELMDEQYVVDIRPEETARQFRAYLEKSTQKSA